MKFNIKEWQDKQLNEGPSHKYNAAYLDLKDAYYGIADEVADMGANIEAFRNIPEGQKYFEEKGVDGNKEIRLFKQIERLFNQSKLGKIM